MRSSESPPRSFSHVSHIPSDKAAGNKKVASPHNTMIIFRLHTMLVDANLRAPHQLRPATLSLPRF